MQLVINAEDQILLQADNAQGLETTTAAALTATTKAAEALASAAIALDAAENASAISYGPQTANSIPYFNGAATFTTGSALTFDGTNLGVGTSSPAQKFQVSGASAATYALVTNAGTGPSNLFLGAGNGVTQIIAQDGAAGAVPLTFLLGTTEQMRLNSTGLGIGTSSPSSKLTIGGSGANRISFVAPAGVQYVGYDGSTDTLQVASINSITFQAGGYTERLRIDSAGNIFEIQPAPAAVDTTATLTVANLRTRIITSTTAAAVTGTLPTGTLMDGMYAGNTDMGYDWSVINTGTNAFTVAAGTTHTVVGNMAVPANTSGLFRSRRTAANTWITYRVS